MARIQRSFPDFAVNWHVVAAALFATAILLAGSSAAWAQTLTVLHSFTGQGDGGEPFAGVTLDRAGNIYGTTSAGNVFKLTHYSGGWGLTNLHTFRGGDDGSEPQARVVFGPDGTLYGTTTTGGRSNQGTVYNLRPLATFCRTIQCPWTETVIHSFAGGEDGSQPQYGDLVFDAAGNVYGTTSAGGAGSCGTVFKLSRSGGSWTESILYSLNAATDGCVPYAGVTLDSAGNLYGTTTQGGSADGGTVFKLTHSGSSWTASTLYSFGAPGDGSSPYGGVAINPQGNLYGTTFVGGSGNGGIVYELQPFEGGWTYTVLYAFDQIQGPFDTPTLDAAGNLYATTFGGGRYSLGNVFKLTPGAHGWTYTNIHDFNGRDGIEPIGGVSLDSSGNLYGTTFYDFGEVFKITP